MSFHSFGLGPQLLEGIDAMGYTQATPIQEQAIPEILSKHDLIGCAQTGTGKTAAFVIPIVQNLSKGTHDKIRCLIIVPTRELASQIDQQIMGLGYFADVSSCPVYGGNQPMLFDTQKKAIESGADILIATPGRFIGHMNLGYLDLSGIETLVLDEADRMLDMGFHEDLMKIMKELPTKRQTLMFSATMPPPIRKLAKQILTNPIEINIAIAKPAEGIKHVAYLTFNDNKIKLLEHVIREREVESMIIFASKKTSVKDIYRKLKELKYNVESMHSDRPQDERNEIMRLFKAGKLRILVATDVLSRGIDIEDLSHVLNYDIPRDAEDYVHRVGRTARAEKTGEAISFINPEDQHYFSKIEKLIEREIEKRHTPDQIGKSPEWQPHQKQGKPHRGNRNKPRHNRRKFYGKNKNR